jgi:plasmid maintenance system antidote protein VapI
MTTMDLLDKALRMRRSMSIAAYARSLHFNRTAINVAIYRGTLSPRMAGAIAHDIGEPEQKWIAIAAMEKRQVN